MEAYERLISSLPKTGTSLIFAYGSGAVAQQGIIQSENMVDYIIVVDDAEDWHSMNLKMNKNHYSCIRFVGAENLAKFQRSYGPRIFYNTLVRIDNRLIKYGVIETKNLISDLIDWESLYVAGRLHKPVLKVYQSKNVELNEALNLNLRNACHAALLMLPEQFSYGKFVFSSRFFSRISNVKFNSEQFFTVIASLSYDGDFRQYIAEDKNKIFKIVRANLDAFQIIYEPLINEIEQVYVESDKGRVTQDLSPTAVCDHLERLPKHVLWKMQAHCNRDGRLRDIEEVIHNTARHFEFQDDVSRAIRQIVFVSSVKQTLKNFFTAGIRKSIIYSFNKVRKMIRSLR